MKKISKIKKIKEEYSKSWKYIKESKNFIYSAIVLFCMFVFIGFLFPAPTNIIEPLLNYLKELIAQTQGMNTTELISFIFFNNLQSSFFGIIFGVIFGIFPILVTIANGYILGFVGSLSVQAEGWMVLFRLLPHGIFELPAAFISFGLGIKFGTFMFKKNKLKSFNSFFVNSLRVFLLIVVPLLILAAIIEGMLISVFP